MGFRFNNFDCKLIYNNPNSKLLEAMCKNHNAFFAFRYLDYLLDDMKDIPKELLLNLSKFASPHDLYTIVERLLGYHIDVPDFVLEEISKLGAQSCKTCRIYIENKKIPPDIILRGMINFGTNLGKGNFLTFLERWRKMVSGELDKNMVDEVKNKIAEIEKEKSVKQESFSFKSYFMR
jgi:hypothetical protein